MDEPKTVEAEVGRGAPAPIPMTPERRDEIKTRLNLTCKAIAAMGFEKLPAAAEAMRELLQEVERLEADVKCLQADLARWKRAIEGLTPSGSEFVNDPEACAAHIRARTRWPSIALRWKERAEGLRAALQDIADRSAKPDDWDGWACVPWGCGNEGDIANAALSVGVHSGAKIARKALRRW